MFPALALLAAVALGLAAYPRLVERRQRRRRTIGPDGVVLGAAAINLPKTNAPAVLLLHGGGDTPQTLGELARYLHKRGFSVRAPLLSGHGRHLAALSACSAHQWHDEVQREFDAMRSVHGWVAVVGLSMGGALAVKLASERHVEALVLLAPYIAMPRFARGLAVSSPAWGWMLPYFSSFGTHSIRDPEAASRALGYGYITPAILRALYSVVNDAARSLPLVKAPTLVIQSREDNRIPPETAERAFAQLGSAKKRFVWTDGAGHVITVDYGYQRVFELTAGWLEAHRERSS